MKEINRNYEYVYETPKQPEVSGRILLNNNDISYEGLYDGDTIYLSSTHSIFDTIEKKEDGSFLFRFAGIDTSEIAQNEPFSEEAKAFTKRLIENCDDMKILLRVHHNNESIPDVGRYNRPIGVVYVKNNNKWINVNRSLLVNWLAVAPLEYVDQMHTTDEEKKQYEMDYLSGTINSKHAERTINSDHREDYLGNFNPVKEVRIGDVQLPIPPDNITVTTINKTAQQESKVIRNQTTLISSTGYNMKQIRLDFYINGLDQINGIQKDAIDITGEPIRLVKNAVDRARIKNGERLNSENENRQNVNIEDFMLWCKQYGIKNPYTSEIKYDYIAAYLDDINPDPWNSLSEEEKEEDINKTMNGEKTGEEMSREEALEYLMSTYVWPEKYKINPNNPLEIPEKIYITPTYYVNGLRCLLAQFKLTPFLPIENESINFEHDISAITLQNITVSNVQNFPNVLRVSLVAMEFNYQVYIDTVKPFKEVFNWDLFRFYYQRLLEGTNMANEEITKFPVVESLDTEHFSFDVVDKFSLQKQEQAIQYLNKVAKDINIAIKTNTYESDSDTLIWDNYVIQDAMVQFNQWKIFEKEAIEEYAEEYNINKAETINDAIELENPTDHKKYNYIAFYDIINSIKAKLNNWLEEEMSKDEGDRVLKTDSIYFDPKVPDIQRHFIVETYGFRPEYNYGFNLPIMNSKNREYILNIIETYGKNYDINEHLLRTPLLTHKPAPTLMVYIANNTTPTDNEQSLYIVPEIFNMIHNEVVDEGQEALKKREDAENVVHKGEDIYKWNVIDFNNINVQNIGVSLSNKVVPININMQTKPTHQYLGSKNITISIDFITRDTNDIQKINALVDHVKEMQLRYGEIINSPLLKFNNSLVEIFNIDGVEIRDLNVNTVPNFPGARMVQLTLIGYYKPSKDFESLSRIFKTEASEVLRFNMKIDKASSQDDIENLFSIKERMAKINLYPDLELPKYCELPENIPYLYQEFNEKYVDPDFYALNIDRLFTEETFKVLNIEEYQDSELHISDSSGDQLDVEIDDAGIPRNNHFVGQYDISEINVEDLISESPEWPSKHFTQDQFDEASSVWPIEMTDSFRELLVGLDILKTIIGKEININSAVRSREHNRRVNGAERSRHLIDYYCAVDICVEGYTSEQLMKIVEDLNIFTGRGLYPYSNTGYIHVDTRNGLKGLSNIVRWYEDESGSLQIAGRDYDPEKDGPFNGYVKKVSWEGPSPLEGDRNLYGDASDSSARIISEKTEEIYNKYNPTVREKFEKGNMFEVKKLLDDFNFDGFYINKETAILAAVILSQWDSELIEGDEFIFPGDRIAFNLPEAALDQYKDWQKKMNIPHESTQLFVESSLKLQALVLAGYAEKYYQKYYPIIEENDDINWLNANRDRDKINRLIAISKILSYMHCYGITLENIARPDPNYINFMEDFKKYYIELDVHGFIVTDVFDDEEIQSLNNHLSSLARDILEEADNAGEDFTYLLDADEITDVVGKYKGDNIVLRDKEERFKDSFHDMMKYDKRGRLIRAFPTYYLMLIDEGKDLWIWKLQDLFYDYHGVESIDLVRSQENIADSCVIKMSNQSNHLSDATGGYKKVRVDYGFWQTILSIFPFDDYNIEKLKREQEFKSVQLQTGARLHLRMGYGSNPLSLPTVFNGTITELQLGDQINLIAQNDGIELNKPMDYAPKTTNNKQGIGITEEPKEIITDILGDRGGIWATFWRGVTTNLTGDNKPWIYEDNVHGIRHLGALARPDWWSQYRINKRHIKNDAIHDDAKNHEISQNIYDSNRETDGEDLEHIEIALFMYGKTPWDIIQTCSMASPNYVSYIHPFSIGRNTIFYGHPTFDLAYDYEKVNSDDSLGEDDKYQESIKTFRQMHIYGSFYDIISNNIKASSKNIYTAVKPVMSDFEGDTRKLDTLYLDTDIYPEYQKQISIDTSLKVPGLFRTIGQAINLVQEIEGNAARRFGANALKQFVNTMYQGNINVLGDPSVKPYDYSYLYDMENQMNGMFEVNTVVQTMSKDTGFITSISPNPITVINKGIKRDLEYFMWATSRMGTVYRTFFTIRALIAALARSVKVGNINLVSLVQKMAINTARNFGESAMGLASRANNATNQMLKILADFEHKGLNPSKWETFKASKWGARMEVVRDGIDDSIKYIVNYTDDAKDVAQYIKYAKLGLQYSDEAAGVAHAYAKASRFKTALAYVLKYGDDIVSILTGPIGIATKMFIEHIVFTLATRFLQRKRENREVITMMLLNKNGEPFEAGIEGHKGCVLGDRPSKIDELVNSDLINFFIGVNQSQRMRSQLSNSINESYEELETDVRDLTQNAYAATYADNESTLYDYEKTMEIYREDVKRRYNEQAGFLNDLETDDENVAWDISDIKIFDDRNDWIIKACDSVNRDRDILDEYENTEMTLHPDLIFLLERIRDKNIPFSLKSESPLYTNLNNCGLGITIKVDYEDDMQRMVDTLLNSNVKSFHFFDNNSVHIDLGPHNLKNPLSDIAIDKEIFWNPGSPVREVVSINDPRQYNIFKHRTRGMLDRSN